MKARPTQSRKGVKGQLPILESTEEVRVGYNRTETVRYHVSDPDSHGFTCELQDPSGAVAIRKEGDRLCLDIFNYKRTPGNYTAHVSVSDSFGASDTADFDFTLLPDQPPVATGGFRPVYLGSMQETAEFTPSQGFDDVGGVGNVKLPRHGRMRKRHVLELHPVRKDGAEAQFFGRLNQKLFVADERDG